jgi:hypothetical protein
MAARRLVIIMLVLLGVAAGLAALAPDRESGEDTVGSSETETTTETEAAAAEPSGDTETASGPQTEGPQVPLTFDIKVGGKKLPVVPVEPGEPFSLVVRSQAADQVEIPRLGLIDAVGPGAPARFELLAEAEGDLGVRLVNAERLVARIEVRSEAREGSGRPGSKRRPEPDRS